MSETVSITVTQKQDYQFLVDFGKAMPTLVADEPSPMGKGEGPAPTQMLLAAVANCLSASLIFSLTKFKQDAGGITTIATCVVDRNKKNRFRIQKIDVAIRLGKQREILTHLDHAIGQFEDFCTVTQSVQTGIPVKITITDSNGERIE